MFVMFLAALFLVTEATTDGAQAIALTLAGAVSTVVMLGIKKLYKPTVPGTTSSLHGTKAFAFTIGVSLVVTVIALLVSRDPAFMLLISGDFSNLPGLYSAAWSVVGLATAVYKFFMEKNKPLKS